MSTTSPGSGTTQLAGSGVVELLVVVLDVVVTDIVKLVGVLEVLVVLVVLVMTRHVGGVP